MYQQYVEQDYKVLSIKQQTWLLARLLDQVQCQYPCGFHNSLDCTRQSQMLFTSNKQLLQNIMLLGNKIDKNYIKAINEYMFIQS